MNVHGCTIYNSQKIETIQVSISRRMGTQMWHIHIGEYYSALKRDEILRHAVIGMNLKNIMLSGRCQTQEAVYWMITLI